MSYSRFQATHYYHTRNAVNVGLQVGTKVFQVYLFFNVTYSAVWIIPPETICKFHSPTHTNLTIFWILYFGVEKSDLLNRPSIQQLEILCFQYL